MSYCFKTSLHPPQTARVSVCCQNPNKQICINLSPCHYSCSVKIVSRLPTRCFVMDSSVNSVWYKGGNIGGSFWPWPENSTWDWMSAESTFRSLSLDPISGISHSHTSSWSAILSCMQYSYISPQASTHPAFYHKPSCAWHDFPPAGW